MKIRNLSAIMILLSFLMSCSKEDIPLFESNVAGVYFQTVSSWVVGGAENYTDSTTLSFSGRAASVTSLDINIQIKTMGKQVDYDRPVKVVIDPERTTAVQGVHFEVNTDTIRVKANESITYVPLRFLRTPDMTEKTFCVAFKIEDNEYFKCHLPEYKNTSSYTATGKQIPGDKYIVAISESYTEPFYWSFFGGSFFGSWTPLRYVVVNSVCGWTPSDWSRAGMAGTKILYGRFSFAAKLVQQYLQEMADSGTPVKNNDGSYMVIGEAYPIDYSKYQ